MKQSLSLVIVMFGFHVCFAQNILVIDSLTKEPVAFAAIKFNENGFYTSQKGVFNLNKVSTDSFEVNLLGYKKIFFKTSNVKDTIFLKNQIDILDEVVLTKKNKKFKEIKLTKIPRNFGSWILQPETEIIISILPSEEIQGFYIDEINIGFAKVREKKELKNTNIKAFVRLHIYEPQKGKLLKSIYSSEPVDINSFDKDEVSFDVSNNLITLKENGIFIALELIGYYADGLVENVSNPIVRPLFTDQENHFFTSRTFIRYIFKNPNDLISVNDLLQKSLSGNKKVMRNLNIGLKISK